MFNHFNKRNQELERQNKRHNLRSKKFSNNENRVIKLCTSLMEMHDQNKRINKEIEGMFGDYEQNLDKVNLQLRITSKQIVAGQLKHKEFDNYDRC